MAYKITRAVASDGTVSYTEEEQTMIGGLIDGALSPLSLLSDSNEYMAKSNVGAAVLGAFAGGVYVGDRFDVPVIGNNY